jgi:uncharacterized membrane protein (DUF4010 family)
VNNFANSGPGIVAERLAIAALVGLAAGIEREWSGPTSGPARRFAGLRTFFMFGLLGGISGILLASDQPGSAAALLAGGAGFIVAAYVMAVRRPEQPLDGTTEGAALVVLGLGALAGLGYLGIAAGSIAIVVFTLGEKERLHWLVSRIGKTEMYATMQFLVLALVVLPLLPTGPYEQLIGLRPRMLWSIVVLLSGLNFVGYLARRAIGPTRGYALTGLLGGVVSSTALTLQFSRLSHADPARSDALGVGVIAASLVVPIRVVLVTAALNPALALTVLPYLLPAALTGIVAVALALRHPSPPAGDAPEARSPLRLRSALQMAVLFQVAMFVAAFARARLGSAGTMTTGVVVGVADADALAVAMSRVAEVTGDIRVAAQAIVAGVIATTLFKLVLSAILGSPVFRRRVAPGLLVMSAAFGVAAWWGWLR